MVSLAWADKGSYRFVVVSGHGKITNDRAMIEELWSDMDKTWWEVKDDPSIWLLNVTPERGEIWDAPRAPVSGVKMLIVAVTGGHPSLVTTPLSKCSACCAHIQMSQPPKFSLVGLFMPR